MSILVLALVCGLATGMLSGMVGIGGGVVLVPLLLYLFKVPMHTAAGTSLAIVIPTAIVGAVNHFLHGNVDWRLALMIGVGGVCGSFLGSWAANLLPAVTLKKIFAVIMLIIALNVVKDAFNITLWHHQPDHREPAQAVPAHMPEEGGRGE